MAADLRTTSHAVGLDCITARDRLSLGARRLTLPGHQPKDFAHPAEAMLGELLTFHRIRWVYEPTSFVLKRTPGGAVSESFTPDFYLPDHRLYLELTTMRQPLVTRKNGKIRRLRELFPTVQIKTLYRRDYDRIVQIATPKTQPRSGGESVVFSAEQIAIRTTELAREIAIALHESGTFADPLILTAIKLEAIPFQMLLATELVVFGIDVELDRLELSRFKLDAAQRRVSVLHRPAHAVKGRATLLIAGATSTGLSLECGFRHLRGQRPSWLEAVSLLDRGAARVIDTTVRFRGFEAPSDILHGFGLSLGDGDSGRAISRAATTRGVTSIIADD